MESVHAVMIKMNIFYFPTRMYVNTFLQFIIVILYKSKKEIGLSLICLKYSYQREHFFFRNTFIEQ